MLEKIYKIGITGANGFIGKNLIFQLRDIGYDVEPINRNNFKDIDFTHIIHCAGVNRPIDNDFSANYTYLDKLIKKYPSSKHLYVSSTKISSDSDYGKSKRKGEFICAINDGTVLRLPNVFGKWCKPNYNSVISTFIHNKFNNKELIVKDDSVIDFIFIDDVIESVIDWLNDKDFHILSSKKSIKQVKEIIERFELGNLYMEFNDEFEKKLYSVYLSVFGAKKFSLKTFTDDRGSFTEQMKGNLNGQFSVNICLNEKKKGGHYHHTKFERFIIVKGCGVLELENIITGELITFELNENEFIDIPPMYRHTIYPKNNDLIFNIYTPFIFDKLKSDTYE